MLRLLDGSLKKKNKRVGREETGCAMRGTRFTTLLRGGGAGGRENTENSTVLKVPRFCPFVLPVINLHLT